MERQLRSGFTTGTCAAAAAKAAAFMLYSGKRLESVEITTPKKTKARMTLYKAEAGENSVRCAVKKDAGDDPDVTDQTLVEAVVQKITKDGNFCLRPEWYESEDFPGIYLTGGEGIGLVTKPGLSCPVGKHAINPVPRKMIFQAVGQVREEWDEAEPCLITIEIPEGKFLAEKTFNPRLGITGRLSVLGTTGIVEPMSEAALLATIQLDIHMKAVDGKKEIILTPGNYGETFLKESMKTRAQNEEPVLCSNFVKAAVCMAAEEGFQRGLFVGHIGKLIKVAGGVENTHSKYGDRRMEFLWKFAEEAIKDQGEVFKIREEILSSNTTEEALEILERAGIRRRTGEKIAKAIQRQILSWTNGRLLMAVVVFSQNFGMTGEAGAEK